MRTGTACSWTHDDRVRIANESAALQLLGIDGARDQRRGRSACRLRLPRAGAREALELLARQDPQRAQAPLRLRENGPLVLLAFTALQGPRRHRHARSSSRTSRRSRSRRSSSSSHRSAASPRASRTRYATRWARSATPRSCCANRRHLPSRGCAPGRDRARQRGAHQRGDRKRADALARAAAVPGADRAERMAATLHPPSFSRATPMQSVRVELAAPGSGSEVRAPTRRIFARS
jgi:hypothetical protein